MSVSVDEAALRTVKATLSRRTSSSWAHKSASERSLVQLRPNSGKADGSMRITHPAFGDAPNGHKIVARWSVYSHAS